MNTKRLWLSSTGKYHVELCNAKGVKGGTVDAVPTDLYRLGRMIFDRVPWCCYDKLPKVATVLTWEDGE